MGSGPDDYRPIEVLERELDALRHRSHRRTFVLALTNDNARRAFGLSLWELFLRLADRFGYEVPDAEPPDEA